MKMKLDLRKHLTALVFLLLFITYFSTPSKAQGIFQTVSTGTDDYIFSTKQAADGSYISLGYTSGVGFGSFDFLLINSDQDGNYLWSMVYGGSNTDLGYAVEATSDGGFILAGATQSYGAGGADVLLVKVDQTGQVSWAKTFGGSGWDEGFDVAVTEDGGFIVAGRSNSFGAGDGDIYAVKTTASGELSWTKTYGGSGNEDAQQVVQTADGGYIFVGHTVSFGAGNSDIYLVKTNASGDIEWTKTMGGANFENGNTIALTLDGGYIVSGNTNSFGQGESDIYLAKLDNLGNMLWSKTYGGGKTENSYYLVQEAGGEYVMAGLTNSFGGGGVDAFLIKVNASGDVLWSKTYGGGMDDFCNALHLSAEGRYIFAGNSRSFDMQNRAYILSADEQGNSGGCNQFTPSITAVDVSFQVGSGGSTASGGTSQSPTIMADQLNTQDSILCLITQVNESFEPTNYSIYPNPISHLGVLTFDNPNQRQHQLLLYDLHGKIVWSKDDITTDRIPIYKGSLSSGLYLFVLLSDGAIKTKGKIVLE
ncbi:MAG: T9SS type A sorting domain-containing protein [Bacteroidota bacterium]